MALLFILSKSEHTIGKENYCTEWFPGKFLWLSKDAWIKSSFFSSTRPHHIWGRATISGAAPWGKLTKDKNHTLRMTEPSSSVMRPRQWIGLLTWDLVPSRHFNMWTTVFPYCLHHLEFRFLLLETKNHLVSFPLTLFPNLCCYIIIP